MVGSDYNLFMALTPKERKEEVHLIDEGFKISVALKGIDGIIELLGAVFLIFTPLASLNNLLIKITRKEILKDPNDLIANSLLRLAHSISLDALDFTIVFLFIHGAVKVFIVTMLLLKKLWAYPLAIIVFGIFGVYQTYQYKQNHSIGLLALTILDIAMIILTLIEYQNIKKDSNLQLSF